MVQSNTNRSASFRNVDGQETQIGRRSSPLKDRGLLVANIQSPSHAELLGFLQRLLAGEAYPVSGPRGNAAAAEDAASLAERIREILRAEQQREDGLAVQPAESPPEPPRGSPILLLSPLPTVEPVVVAQPLDSVLLAPVVGAPSSPVRQWPLGWGSAAFALLITVGSACIPGVLADPPRYAAEARLQLLGTARTAPGYLDATAVRLTSSSLIAQAVAKLKLDRDPEFSGGKATSYSVVMDLLTDSGGATDNFSRAQQALRQKLTVLADRPAAMIGLTVQSADATKSARIANFLADAAIRDAVARPFDSQPAASDTALENSRKSYDAANAALAAFKATTGVDKIDAATSLMEQKRDLGGQIAAATAAVQAATIRLAAAKAVRMADVLDGSISPDLGSPAPLEDLRNRYAAARSLLGQLSTQLGPRHPRLLAVQSTIDTLSAAIVAEIQRMVVASDTEVKTRATQQRQLKDKLAALSNQAVDVDLATFGRLQGNAEAARQRYEDALAVTDEIKTSSISADVPLGLAVSAVPSPVPLDDNLLGREMIGGLCGLVLALALIGFRLLSGRLLHRKSFDEDQMNFESIDLLAEVPAVAAPARAPLHPPAQTSGAPSSFATDRPVQTASDMPGEAAPALAAIIDDVASLRNKVATYVAQRQAALH